MSVAWSRRSRRLMPPCCCSVNRARARNCLRVPCTTHRRAASSASWRSTARRFRTLCWRANSSATNGARLPEPPSRHSGGSKRRTAAPCFWTRSATCRARCRPSCCAFCRSARSNGWAVAKRFRSTCASSARPTRTCSARIAEGTFREDLFYRLAEIVVTVPPLRDRAGDAVLLAHALARRFADELKRGRISLGDDALDLIERHRWPGNVRELENVIKRAVILADGAVIQARDLGMALGAPARSPRR